MLKERLPLKFNELHYIGRRPVNDSTHLLKETPHKYVHYRTYTTYHDGEFVLTFYRREK